MDARQLVRALGGKWSGSYGVAKCPIHEDRTPSLKIKDDPHKSDGLDLHCFAGCDWRAVKAELQRQRLIEGIGAERSVIPTSRCRSNQNNHLDDDTGARIAHALKLWRESVALANATFAERYFVEHRKLDIRQLDLGHALRWHAGIRAVVALMTDPESNQPCGIHRTFLYPDGSKRERKMLGKQGVVRLSPDEEVTQGLGIAEGIEDGLAVLLSGWAPVWAATSSGAIERFPVLAGIESLTVFADADEAGIKAAHRCTERWAAAGREARTSHLGGTQ
jgi:putative DNA primase/helicase